MSNIVPFEQQQAIAKAVVASRLFGMTTEAQALALMALCEAEGMHPVRALQEFHIIQGRPALKADAMLARFQQRGGAVKWIEYSDAKVCGEFSHPQGGTLRVEWTIEQAKKIGLAGKDNWKNYPRAMLRSRCISEGVRAVAPGVATGIYTVDEVQDMTTHELQDSGPIEVVDPWNTEQITEATVAADKGVLEYQRWWKGQEPTWRDRAVGTKRHADFKAKASEVAA
jgi:hypothetical protein